MANASPADTRAGWSLYHAQIEKPSLAELNALLSVAGFGPVSPRTFDHYRDLERAGYESYLAINRFDVARASRPFENVSASGRYRTTPSELSVQFSVVRESDVFVATAVVRELSDSGAVIVVVGVEEIAGLKRAKLASAETVSVTFPGLQRSVLARVTEISQAADAVSVEIEFSRLRSISEFVDVSALPIERFSIRVTGQSDDERSADLVARRIYYTLDLIESCRNLLNELLLASEEEVDAERQLIEPASIVRLQVASPLEMVVLIGSPVALVVRSIWKQIDRSVETVGKIQDVKAKAAESRKKDAEARRQELANERFSAENETLGIAHKALQSLLSRAQQNSTKPPTQRELALVRDTFEIAAKLEATQVSSFEFVKSRSVAQRPVEVETDPE